MKKRRNLLVLLATLCMVTSLCACSSSKDEETSAKTETETKVDVKEELVASNWECTESVGDELSTMLSSYNFAEPEIAFADEKDFTWSRVFTFQDDGTATLVYDTDKIWQTYYDGLDHFMETLYENREDLLEVYGEEVMEEEDPEAFKDFLAWGVTGGEMEEADDLLNAFADNIVTYYFASNEYTSLDGTYTIDENTVKVELSEDVTDEFAFDAAVGTLTGSDGKVFSKVKPGEKTDSEE